MSLWSMFFPCKYFSARIKLAIMYSGVRKALYLSLSLRRFSVF